MYNIYINIYIYIYDILLNIFDVRWVPESFDGSCWIRISAARPVRSPMI